MMMFLIFSLMIISGPVGCAVRGHLGGSVCIVSNVKLVSAFQGHICKDQINICKNVVFTGTTEYSEDGRFLRYKSIQGFFSVLIRRLKLQDAGTYRMGIINGTETLVNLTVVNDSCCAEPKTLNAFAGQNIDVSFNYPMENEERNKYFIKLENGTKFQVIVDTYRELQSTRFSISDDRSAKVLSVNINNVNEADGGVYLSGYHCSINSIQYISFFSEIQMKVTASSFTIIIIIIISVCLCVSLLLIGGITLLIYKLRHKRTQGSSLQDTVQAPSVYETDLPNSAQYVNLNVRITSNLQDRDSSTIQSDSTYQTLDPFSNQSDSGYTSLNNTTCQSESQYQSLNPRTRTNSVYQTLQS